MNLKGLLPQDAEFLERWLDETRFERCLDLAETYLLRHSVGRIAANNIRREYPKKPGEGWGDPMPRREQLYHIVDWLIADLEAGAPWLANVDEQGRPRKLMKCSTFDDLEREADKAMDRRNGGRSKKALGHDDEERVAVLGGGYTLVRLLTPAALDLESDRMHHCLGDGAYDKKLASGWGRYLSVRDRKNRPVATVELGREDNGRWSLRQVSGKRNVRPSREVMDVIRPYAAEQGWQDRHYWWPVAEAPDDVYYDLDRIPEGTTVLYIDIDDGALWVYPDLVLPDGLTVIERADLTPRVSLPERMTVGSVLSFSRRAEDDPLIRLPESLHAEEIRVGAASDLARPIPTHLVHRIRYRVEKLTGFAWTAMEWVDELYPIDEDDPAPRP